MKLTDGLLRSWRQRFGLRVLLWIAAGFLTTAPVLAEVEADRAETGRFDQLLAGLKSGSEEPRSGRLASLIVQIEQYQQQRRKQLSERQEAYGDFLKEVVQHVEAGELDEALYNSVRAKDMAVDKERILTEPAVLNMVEKAAAAAAVAEAEGRWLDALALYRGLDELFLIKGTYADQVRRVTGHARVLRIYVPEQYEKMYQDRARRRQKEDEQELSPLNLDNEDWVERLADIEWTMLRDILHNSRKEHIDGRGFRPMLDGAIEALLTLINTDGLEVAFDGLVDPIKRRRFRDKLLQIQEELENLDDDPKWPKVLRILEHIKSQNHDTLRLPQGVIVFELAEGAAGTLDDYSSVIWPQDLPDLLRTLQGNFSGVGILISRRKKDQRLLVSSPLPDTPAMGAGIRAGDIIATVDGVNTDGWTLNKAVEKITGPEGTKVTLDIERAGEPDLLEKVLVRRKIKIDSVRGWARSEDRAWDYMIDDEWRIGYVRLLQFLPQSADDMDNAIKQLEADGPLSGLILDLRFNPGGLLSAAVDVADRFIQNGRIVSTVDAQGGQQDTRQAKPQKTYGGFPVVVLINQGSASASEIVAGALQDYDRAAIVGTRSFGKGSVQDVKWFPNALMPKWGMKLTTQYYRLPKNRIIHRKERAKSWGIEPDLAVDITDERVFDAVVYRQNLDVLHLDDEPENPDEPWPKAQKLLEDGLDPQLQAAILELKARMIPDLLEPKQAQAALEQVK